MTLLLSRLDVQSLLDCDAVIRAVADACVTYTAGGTDTPLRATIASPRAEGILLAMPCAIMERPIIGTKIVSVFPHNRTIPRVSSLYVVTDPDTGETLAVMDGTALTAARTAGASAVATDHLARVDSESLGVFGTGLQARAHVEMILRVRRLTKVLVCGTSDESAAAFAEWVTTTFGVPAEATSHHNTSQADILACCTTSATPLFDNVRPGTHVNAVGAFTPTTREIPTSVIVNATVIVDTRLGACAEAGDLLLPVHEGRYHLDCIAGELGDVIAGRTPARNALSPDAVTVYKSVGAAFLDAATARLILERAADTGIGSSFAFG